MLELDDPAVTFRIHLHQDIALLRRFARILTGTQQWADLCVVQLMEDLLLEPQLLDLAMAPKVALYRRLLQLLSLVPPDMEGGDRPYVTPLSRQARLLTVVEGFTRADASDVLGVSPDKLDALHQQAKFALARQSGARIMIIEDEAFLALELEFLVSDLGHEYLATAATSAEAVDKALLLKPDLILSDVQLGDGSSGITATQEIQQHFDVPIIFITANSDRLLTGKRPEPVFLIEKPFRKDVVKAMISQALFIRQGITE